MTLGAILAGLHDAFRPMVVEGITRARLDGIVVDLDSGRRDAATQQNLYNIFRSGGPRAAPPGLSAHEYGLAVDIAVVEGGRRLYAGQSFERAVECFKKAGCEFLAPLYDDPGHAQHPQWKQLARTEGYDGNPHVPPREGPTPSGPIGIPDRSNPVPTGTQPGGAGAQGALPRCRPSRRS